MSVNSFVRMSLEEARAKRDRGETRTREDAPIGPSLGPDFWADAVLVEPQGRKSVHLRLQAEVYDFFVAQSGGKGHIKKMQQVLKAYVDAHK
ncbi:MAG TPA: hypothetical protein DIU09_15780 [Hyphomonadaceae bacterium]|nr:hypothetical protein AEM38_11590 [Hyphomonadaceae bacterium UKL13-1]OYU53371.1 MAG: hypothetical protein CFE27_00380 [Alphaproteobacteria bacterium PA1]HCP66032.1 hypothetical protein [Hyphomonadaceae bacterium]